MRTTLLVTAMLVATLAACGDDDGSRPPDTTIGAPGTTTTTTTTAPDVQPLDDCPEVDVEPGTDGIAWTAATDDPWGFTTLTVGVDDGFLISTMECVTVVDLDGTRRWSRQTGHILNSVQTGDRIVVLTTPITPDGAILTAYDAASGQTVWDDTSTTGAWQSLIAVGDVVVVVGTGDGALAAIFDSATGEALDIRSGRAGASPVVPLSHEERVIIGLTDESEGRLLVVDSTGSLEVDRPVAPRYPVPVATLGDLIVMQASGLDDNTDDVEPASFLVAHDLAGGERWRQTVEGSHAERAVQVDDTVVMSTSAGITALDIESGDIRWSSGEDTEQPASITALGEDAVASARPDGTVAVFELADGTLRWVRPGAPVARLVGTATGDLLVVDDDGHYELLDPIDGSRMWSAPGLVPTRRDTPPNHRQVVEVGGSFATIACPGDLARCERTDQRVVVVRPQVR